MIQTLCCLFTLTIFQSKYFVQSLSHIILFCGNTIAIQSASAAATCSTVFIGCLYCALSHRTLHTIGLLGPFACCGWNRRWECQDEGKTKWGTKKSPNNEFRKKLRELAALVTIAQQFIIISDPHSQPVTYSENVIKVLY